MKHVVEVDWYVGFYLEELVRFFEIPVMIPKWLHKNLKIWDYAYWKAQILALKICFFIQNHLILAAADRSFLKNIILKIVGKFYEHIWNRVLF